ncbi:class IV adenylate cyclase [Photobacterium rosenbergii]|uniref:Class IV adenylate cyclase n=1 Tax=Photobacterium rosenbergii TaxID=294936 RepID=A0ABU3ZH44_9GAMM|nr:class IV adenylate cyclase [Photobacterium rosenbergii]MDV5169313.1 class IV adenylate cyclase [Photobacterium rosenbergii]
MSSEHFKGKYEVELKYRVGAKTEFLQVLSSLPHEVMLLDNTETDWYFDTPEHSLGAQNKSVSIREMEPYGIKLWIVKGPEADRCEATNITDAKAAKSMLANMGYEPYLVMKKVRSIYFVGQYHITLDFLEGIGHFAEFAIMTDDEALLARYKGELEQLASQFGLTDGDLEHRSYRTLYQMQSTL